jgi:hypothetical protein
MVDELFSRCSSIDLMALVHIFQQLGGGCFGDAVLEVRADIGGAVRAVLLAQVAKDKIGGLLWIELRLLFIFLGGRHRSGVWTSGWLLAESWSWR